jgi:bifunctional DNA-binding transcriptional regulator/antitoxin component of YhaV-PrlF toxin-antitoxin module
MSDLPVEFSAFLRPSHKIAIPARVRERYNIGKGDIVQVTITGFRDREHRGFWHGLAPNKQLPVTRKVQDNRGVIEIPKIIRTLCNLESGRHEVFVRLERVIHPTRKGAGRGRYMWAGTFNAGDVVVVRIVAVNGEIVPEHRQLSLTTRVQKSHIIYIPYFVLAVYGNRDTKLGLFIRKVEGVPDV